MRGARPKNVAIAAAAATALTLIAPLGSSAAFAPTAQKSTIASSSSSASASSALLYSPDPGDPDMLVLDSSSSDPSLPDEFKTKNKKAFLSGAADGSDDDDESNRPMSGIASGTFVPPSDLGDLRLPTREEMARQPPPLQWDVYVCQSKPCRERGAGATLDAFVGLSPPDAVTVHPAVLSRAKGKKQGPVVRCIARESSFGGGIVDGGGATGTGGESGSGKGGDKKGKVDGGKVRAFEVQNVDSVDKVYRILTKHMDIEGIDSSAAECLKYNYRGNAHLEKGELSDAIESYDRAIASGYSDQEGVVLLMRSTAYLKRAFRHQLELKRVVSDLAEAVPQSGSVEALYGLARDHPAMAVSAFKKVASETKSQDKKFRQIKYRHGLYEYALLHAARDALRSTQLLPSYAKTWLRAGDSLAELRKLREAAQYYERAMELDPQLEATLRPVIERLERSQSFLDRARANGWSEDTLRLALDVAG